MASTLERPTAPGKQQEPPAEPPRPRAALRPRATVLSAVALALFAILFLRIWALQVLSGGSYRQTAQENQLRTLRLEAARGPILDRTGKVIVTNTAGSAVEIWPADLPKTWPKARDELRALGRVVGIPATDLWKKINARNGDRLTPILVKQSIPDDAVRYLAERQSDFPGVRIAQHFVRRYPYQSLLAQVVGHVGEIDEAQLKQRQSQGYHLGDEIGQAGVESAFDTYLRGIDGAATLHVDASGRPTSGFLTRIFPTSGNALRLTIDIDLQRAAERGLRLGIQLAHADKKWNANGGAIVAMDPRDGSILAMASNPTYKPSVYTQNDRKKLAPLLDAKVAQAANFPGLDRATQGVYPPGSTFKPLTAIAAMQAHVLEPNALVPCTPDYKSHGQTFKNWTDAYDRGMKLVEALATSCDTYFYSVGEAIFDLPSSAGHPLQDWGSAFGFGAKTGIDIGPEETGLLPSIAWRERTYTKKTDPCCWEVDRLWKPGDSIQLAIGQKDIAVTPLQMTRFYAAIANGGYLVTPHLVADVEQPGSRDSGQQKVLRRFGAPPPVKTNVDPAALQIVQQGLFAATHSVEGTGYGVFGSFPVPIAGKTGTAEKVMHVEGYPDPHLEDQSWWCGYGPYLDPTLVVCALIENGGHGGVAAAPAALKVFEQFFGKRGQITTHATD